MSAGGNSSGGDLFKLVGRILIENADAISAIDDTITKAKELKTAVDGTGESADTAGSKMGSSGKLTSGAVWLGNTMTKLTDKFIGFGKFVGKTGFAFDASMEAFRNQFEALIGDSDKAYKLVDDLQLLAKVSPLGMEGLANNAVSLLNTGTKLEDIIPTLEMLGNLALGDPNKMDSIVRAYTQIISKGQLMAQEMYQLGDAGVPIREIMTMYGGDRYADGSWYALKMKDPTYKIMAEDMVAAFQGATAEGGKWHDYMFKMMDTWLGQTDRMGEEGKESLGAFMNPFFEIAKSDVLPRLSESLSMFGTWVSENQDTLEKMAESIGQLVTVGFDKFIGAMTWMMENGEAVAVAIGVIATAMTVGAIAAHPYAAAIMAIAAGLAAMTANNADGDSYNHFFDRFSDEELQNLDDWVDAVNEARDAEALYAQNQDDMDLMQEWLDMQAYRDEMFKKASATDGLIEAYNAWRSGQAENAGKDLYLDVPLRVKDGAEGELQGGLNGMTLEAMVKMVPDYSQIQNAAALTGVTGIDGSHASGLGRVPHDGYIARLHKDEAVLTSSQADIWRGGMMGGTGRLEGMMSQLLGVMGQVANNTRGGAQVVLDSGVLVGQLAPQMDERLGTISGRKGRRN